MHIKYGDCISEKIARKNGGKENMNDGTIHAHFYLAFWRNKVVNDYLDKFRIDK